MGAPRRKTNRCRGSIKPIAVVPWIASSKYTQRSGTVRRAASLLSRTMLPMEVFTTWPRVLEQFLSRSWSTSPSRYSAPLTSCMTRGWPIAIFARARLYLTGKAARNYQPVSTTSCGINRRSSPHSINTFRWFRFYRIALRITRTAKAWLNKNSVTWVLTLSTVVPRQVWCIRATPTTFQQRPASRNWRSKTCLISESC